MSDATTIERMRCLLDLWYIMGKACRMLAEGDVPAFALWDAWCQAGALLRIWADPAVLRLESKLEVLYNGSCHGRSYVTFGEDQVLDALNDMARLWFRLCRMFLERGE